MTISAGGSSGVVFPDSSVISAGGVTAYLAPGMTDTANVMTINPVTTIDGTTGLRVNNTTISTAAPFLPVNTVLPAITGTVQQTQTLTCTTGTWTSTTTITYSYQWIRGTSTVVGTNSSTYVCVAADVGSNIRCVVTADNGTVPTPATSNTVGPVASYLPVNTVAPAVTGTAQETQTLTCSVGTWNNSPTSYSYQWIRGASTNIGTNASTYTCTAADVGSTIKCVVTATNVAGSTPATSNTTAAIASYVPVNTGTPVITGNIRDTQTLTCSTGTWANSPTSYSYQWIRGASTNIGTNASTYTCVTADIGSTIKCTVTATNVAGSASATSTPVGPITANIYTATYLVIAGGGGAGTGVFANGFGGGGGGGAGGYLASTTSFTPGTIYYATVGGGGSGGAPGTQGSPSSIAGSGLTTISSDGGGYGGRAQIGTVSGGNGGSGGGAGMGGGGGTATAGQGNNGAGPSGPSGGGGGGASGGGSALTGGNGVTSAITGTSITRAGGGGGGGYDGNYGNGGTGGGGTGGQSTGTTAGTSGSVNTGSGGGGGTMIQNSDPAQFGGAGSGGSGVVIISVPTANYSGTTTGSPTVTTASGNTILTFNSSGTYTA